MDVHVNYIVVYNPSREKELKLKFTSAELDRQC